ncbi:MAG: DUF2953 domain-containing protein [Clostridia bacterium]|nr:DUF2953 domain-containing protein [Clostridia bacterium]
MTGLYIVLGIILFFVVLFSFKVSVIVEMTNKNKVVLKYLFLKFTLLDSSKPEKEKKPKNKKKEKNKTENTSEETTDNTSTEKTAANNGNNLFKQLYIEQGYDGIVKMLVAVKESLGSFFSKLYKTFTINEFYLTMHVTGSDAADTAIKYGQLSSWLFPVLGKVASTCKMKKYDIDISPDFLGVKNEADLYLDVSVVPIRITNALVVLALQLVFKVILKILFAGNNAKKNVNKENSSAETTNSNSVDTNM